MKMAAALLLFALSATNVQCASDNIELSPDAIGFVMIEGAVTTVSPKVEIVTATKLNKGRLKHLSIQSNVDWISVDVVGVDGKSRQLFFSINDKANALAVGTYEGKTAIMIKDKIANAVTVTLVVEENHPVFIIRNRPHGCTLGVGTTNIFASIWIITILLLVWHVVRLRRR